MKACPFLIEYYLRFFIAFLYQGRTIFVIIIIWDFIWVGFIMEANLPSRLPLQDCLPGKHIMNV